MLSAGLFHPKRWPTVTAFLSGQRSAPLGLLTYCLLQGSTGQPKGVPIAQSNVRSYLQYVCDRYDVDEADRFSQEFDLTFDLSVHDMFVCWERGGCLFSVPETLPRGQSRLGRGDSPNYSCGTLPCALGSGFAGPSQRP